MLRIAGRQTLREKRKRGETWLLINECDVVEFGRFCASVFNVSLHLHQVTDVSHLQIECNSRRVVFRFALRLKHDTVWIHFSFNV